MKLDIENIKGGTHCICSHCGERYGSNNGKCAKYCKTCRTKEGRDEIDKQNKEL